MKYTNGIHSLVINKVHKSNSGIIRCAVRTDKDLISNMPYESLWSTVDLTVVPSEFISVNSHCNSIQSSPKFLSIIGEVKTIAGQTASIKVLFKCDAEPMVRWIAAVSFLLFRI